MVQRSAARHQGKEELSYFLFHIFYFLFPVSYFLFLNSYFERVQRSAARHQGKGALLRSGKRRTTAATETEIGGGHIFVFQIIAFH